MFLLLLVIVLLFNEILLLSFSIKIKIKINLIYDTFRHRASIVTTIGSPTAQRPSAPIAPKISP